MLVLFFRWVIWGLFLADVLGAVKRCDLSVEPPVLGIWTFLIYEWLWILRDVPGDFEFDFETALAVKSLPVSLLEVSLLE